MLTSATHTFERTLRKSNVWVHEIMDELGLDAPDDAMVVLRAGLHALRDAMTVDEAAAFAAQLPMLVRGLFFTSWQPRHVPERMRTAQAFLAGVEQRAQPHRVDARSIVTATAAVMRRHMGRDELSHALAPLPPAVQELWAPPA